MAEESDEKRGLGWGVLSWPDYIRKPHEVVAAFLYFLLGILILIILAIGTSILIRVLGAAFNFENLESIKTPDDFNKILLGLGGLIGALTAVPFLVWRTMIAQKQNIIAQENIHSTTMAKAIEQLGAMKEEKITQDGIDFDGKRKSETATNSKPNIEVRLGAIYLLEKLAREHEQLHWPIMEILCAYVRENAGKPNIPPDDLMEAYAAKYRRTAWHDELIKRRIEEFSPPRVDIQVALIVIGRRSLKQRQLELELQRLNKRRYQLDLSNCNFAKIHFNSLDFKHANFKNSSFELAQLNEVNFSNANLIGTLFMETEIDYAIFDYSALNYSHFGGSIVTHSFFLGARLNYSCFGGAQLERVSMQGCRLFGSDLQGVNFRGAHLEGVELCCATMKGSNVTNAYFDDIRIDEVDLTLVKGLTQTMLDKSWGDDKTILPPELKIPHSEKWTQNSKKDFFDQYDDWENINRYWIDVAAQKLRIDDGL